MHAVNQGSAHASQEAVRIAVVISRLGRCEDIIPKALLWFLLPLPSSSNSPFFLISSDCNGAAICHLGMKKIWRGGRERKSTKRGGRIFWRVPRDVRSRKFRTIERGKLYGMDLEVKWSEEWKSSASVSRCDNNEEGKVIYFGTPGRWRHPTAKFGY